MIIQRLALPLVLFLGLMLTNSYTDLSRDHAFILAGAGDALNYLEIARSAPGLPDQPMPFHHAQRMAVPYLVGLVHQLIPIDLHLLFRIWVFVFEITTLILAAWTLGLLGVSVAHSHLALGALVLNPYAFRYYLTLPGVINDAAFVMGLALLLLSLTRKSIGGIACALLLASLARQTSLLLIPPTLFWILNEREQWRSKGLWIPALAIPIIIYIVSSKVVESFSLPPVNTSAMTGIFAWLLNDFSFKEGAEFLLRGVMPSLLLLAMGLGAYLSHAPARIPWALLFFWIAVCAQPILGGPVVTGQSVARLNALGLVPLTLALGVWFQARLPAISQWMLALGALLGMGSIHHIYTHVGSFSSERAVQFSIGQLGLAVLLSLATYLAAREQRKTA